LMVLKAHDRNAKSLHPQQHNITTTFFVCRMVN